MRPSYDTGMPEPAGIDNDLEDNNGTFSYNDDYTDEVCDTTDVVEFGSVVTPSILTMVITLSLAGNILVLVILAKYENLKSLTNIFILNLAISDLVFTFGLPFWAAYHIWGWTFGLTLCKTVTFVFYIGFYSSIMFLTVLTFHRYLAVVHPLSSHASRRGCYGVTISLVVWMVSLGASIPALIFCSVKENVHDKRLYCEFLDLKWRTVSSYQQNIFFLGAFTVMGFCYIMILKTIVKSRLQMRARTVKLIFCIVAVFFLGWAPYNVVILLTWITKPITCDRQKILDYGLSVCRLIAFSHCCLNPVFYAFAGTKFRNHLQGILQKFCSHRSTVEPQQSMGSMI